MKSLINLSRVWFAIIISGVCYGAWASLNYLPDVVQAILPKGTPYGTLLNITYGSLLLSIYGVMASLISVVTRELSNRYSGGVGLARWIPLERLLKIAAFLIIANQALLTLNISSRWNQIFYQLTRIFIM